jgi:hypothetical protein
LLAIKFESSRFASRGAKICAPESLERRASMMRVEMRPAIPSALPQVLRARRERLLRWVASAVTVLAATIAVLGASMAAVMLGLT